MNDAWCVARPKSRMESEGYHQYQEQGDRIVKKMYADLESLAQNTAGAGAEIRVPTLDGNDKDRWLGKERKPRGEGKVERKKKDDQQRDSKKAVEASNVSADIDLLDSKTAQSASVAPTTKVLNVHIASAVKVRARI